MKIKDNIRFKKRNDYEESLVNRWFVEYMIDQSSYLSIYECLVLTQLPMMYNSRYDKDILTNYDKAIEGYKNWKDFDRRSQLYFTGKYIEIDQERLLLNLINRIVTDLISNEIKCDYIMLCRYLVPIFRLYHVKSFDKNKIFSLFRSFDNTELDRLEEILSIYRRWNIHFLSQVFEDDFSERVYRISNNLKVSEHIIISK